MPELTDDQLDGLFRKSAEEFDPPYDPSAWQDMKARLDTNDHTMPAGALAWKNLLRWGLPVLLLLLLTAGGWYAYDKAQPDGGKPVAQPAANDKARSTQQVDRLKQVVETQSEVAKLSDKQVDKVSAADSPALSDAANGKQPTDEAEPVAKLSKLETHTGEPAIRPDVKGSLEEKGATKRTIPAYKLKTESARMNRSQPERATSKLVTRKATAIEQQTDRMTNPAGNLPTRKLGNRVRRRDLVAISAASYAMPPVRLVTNQRITDNPDWVDVNTSGLSGGGVAPEPVANESAQWLTIAELASRPARWPQSLTFTGRPVVAQPDTTAHKVASTPSVQRGFSVRLVVAPDLSTVGLKNFSRPGTNVGLLLEYRLANRWSVQAGVIHSTKVYKALGSEYVLPAGMTSMKMADVVDGRCTMLDIPVNVRYDFALRPRTDGRLPSRWFVSGGLTTYIMNKEDYHYTYSSYTHGQKSDWTNPNTGTAFGLSNLNLSVGYERSFSRRLSWQVEPFMKVPLKGVGVYKIDLLSTGAFFSLRYKL